MKKLIIVFVCLFIFTACAKVSVYEKKSALESEVSEKVAQIEQQSSEIEEKPVASASVDSTSDSVEAKVEETKSQTEKSTVVNTPDTVAASDEQVTAASAAQNHVTKTLSVKIIGLDEFLFEKSIEYKEDMTALDATLIATEGTEYTVEYSGGKSTAYIKGIGGLYEKEHGAMSGWCYMVNGEKINKGCGRYKLSAGDELRWEYCTDFQEQKST